MSAPPPPVPAFLNGGGDMGARIRTQDWSGTPLGPPESWPQALRAVVTLMLGSRQAMFVVWGPDATMLYNDAYAVILAAKHPAALGRPMAEVWYDIWPQFRSLVERTYAGEALWREDLLVPMERHGYPEDAWFTFSYTPVRDESGAVCGMFCAVTETTAQVLARQRAAFHLDLERRLRSLTDPQEVIATAEAALGRHLGASRVGYGLMDPMARYFTTERNWTDGTVLSHVGTHDLEAFGPELLGALNRGEPAVVHDTATDRRTAAPEILAAFRALGVASGITVSLVKAGRMFAALYVHDRRPRHWREDEVELVREVAERTWSAFERARAEAELRHANEQLADEGERLRELFRQAPGFMYVWRGPEHVYEMANDAYFELLGRRDIIGKPVREAVPEIAGQGFIELADRVYRTGESFLGETLPARLQRRPGVPPEERFLTFVFQPIRDAHGRVTGMFVQGNDVTETKRAEDALRASEQRLRIAQQAGGIGTFELHDDGSLAVSEEFCRLWGVPQRPVIPVEQLAVLIHPDDQPRLTTLYPGRLPSDGLGYIEYRIVRPDTGAMRWIARRGQAVSDGDAQATRILGVCYDITDRKRAEEALQDLNATLERRVAERTADRDRMWRLSTDVMLVARFDGTITAINPAWDTLLGWSEPDLVGTSFLDLVHPEDRAATQDEAARLSSGLTTLRFENRYRRRDGTYRWVSWTAVPDESFIHAVGRDVTTRKEADAALQQAENQLRQAQKMEAVGQLTGGVAHDFNNLLQALSGCLTMIGRRTDEPRVKPLLEAGQQAVDRGAKLVQQLMGFARRNSLRPEPIDVRDRVLAMSALLERALRADIRLETRFAPDLWPIEVDPTQFELALLNLSVNARDAMAGAGRLTVEAANVTLPPGDPSGLGGDYVRLSVTDTGTGMPAEVLAKAFDPFFTTKEVGKGSGLGLAQVYGLARQAGGKAWIDSAEGRGTTVSLLLRRSADAPRAAVVSSSMATPRPNGACVLVVEDDPVVASTVAAALEDEGWRVRRAATADEALPLLSGDERIDLLFSDVVMPGRLSGTELAQEARALRPGMPVVLTTGYSEDVARAAGIKVLSKPYRIQDLSQALHNALADAARESDRAS